MGRPAEMVEVDNGNCTEKSKCILRQTTNYKPGLGTESKFEHLKEEEKKAFTDPLQETELQERENRQHNLLYIQMNRHKTYKFERSPITCSIELVNYQKKIINEVQLGLKTKLNQLQKPTPDLESLVRTSETHSKSALVCEVTRNQRY
ncbi:hypothetical protein L2E82_06306 [Cichorium intybus]|uniref:Uncharacterized protein n=1 Tax=Cichorium intybus TaxID=13427 RepID=A0ACB9HA87_CICIN|nr:hypothetical protein L2E82_06306 [Cichorium intybus]